MKGLRLHRQVVFRNRCLLKSSPVYEGIKTVDRLRTEQECTLKSSPVYEGIKTKSMSAPKRLIAVEK